jgi:hypothetical protein
MPFTRKEESFVRPIPPVIAEKRSVHGHRPVYRRGMQTSDPFLAASLETAVPMIEQNHL